MEDSNTDYVNQIHLIGKGDEENRNFLKLLHDSNGLTDLSKWFDISDSRISLRGKIDKDMRLDKFLEGINSEAYIILQIASPDPFDIMYFARLQDSKGTKISARVTCPYNDNNLDAIAGMYQEAFGSNLRDEPAEKGIQEYYKWRLEIGY